MVKVITPFMEAVTTAVLQTNPTVIKFLVYVAACFGLIIALSFTRRFVPRIRIGNFDQPVSACILSADESSTHLAGQLKERLGSQASSKLKENDKRPENVLIIVGHDVHKATLLIKRAISCNPKNNIVVLDVIAHHIRPTDEIINGLAEDDEATFSRSCERGRHSYYKRLVQGLGVEYDEGRIRLATIESTLVNDAAALDELIEFIGAVESNSSMRLTRSEMTRPRVYRLHFRLIAAAFLFSAVFSSPYMSMMDPVTFRPVKGFDPRLKSVAIATNIPIKLGIVHGLLYMFEYFLDPEMFRRHVGQRITTLWFQLFQFARFGQHLQMHVETLVQAADALGSPKLYKRNYVRVFLWLVIAGVMTQNVLTSLAWHSFTEQTIGFILGLIKLIFFDWAPTGAKINRTVGESLAQGIQWVGGAISLSGGLFMNDFVPLHPTAMASLLVLGGAATLLILMRFRNIPLSRLADL